MSLVTLLKSIWQKLSHREAPVPPDKPPQLHPNFDARKQEDDEIGAWSKDDY